MKFEINISSKNLILLIVIFVLFLFSIILFKLYYPNSHRTFFYEKIDNLGLYSEKRYVPVAKTTDKITAYIEELLLGPIKPRFRPIFPHGTKLLSCFIRKDVLYVNLSKDILVQDNFASKYWDGAEIFKKNIFKNFRNIDIIEIYIDGKRAYEERNAN
ncbi:MAG: GerMN domain-containing protein [Treponema sp.]|nr:GerMN domain-containing protein [Treponema sp.]